MFSRVLLCALFVGLNCLASETVQPAGGDTVVVTPIPLVVNGISGPERVTIGQTQEWSVSYTADPASNVTVTISWGDESEGTKVAARGVASRASGNIRLAGASHRFLTATAGIRAPYRIYMYVSDAQTTQWAFKDVEVVDSTPPPLQVSVTAVPNNPVYIGQSVTLTANCTGGTGLYNYTWSGKALGGSDSTITTSFDQAGTYYVDLFVTSGNAAQEVVSIPIVVQQSGLAIFLDESSPASTVLNKNVKNARIAAFEFAAEYDDDVESLSFMQTGNAPARTISAAYLYDGSFDPPLLLAGPAVCVSSTDRSILFNCAPGEKLWTVHPGAQNNLYVAVDLNGQAGQTIGITLTGIGVNAKVSFGKCDGYLMTLASNIIWPCAEIMPAGQSFAPGTLNAQLFRFRFAADSQNSGFTAIQGLKLTVVSSHNPSTVLSNTMLYANGAQVDWGTLDGQGHITFTSGIQPLFIVPQNNNVQLMLAADIGAPFAGAETIHIELTDASAVTMDGAIAGGTLPLRSNPFMVVAPPVVGGTTTVTPTAENCAVKKYDAALNLLNGDTKYRVKKWGRYGKVIYLKNPSGGPPQVNVMPSPEKVNLQF